LPSVSIFIDTSRTIIKIKIPINFQISNFKKLIKSFLAKFLIYPKETIRKSSGMIKTNAMNNNVQGLYPLANMGMQYYGNKK